MSRQSPPLDVLLSQSEPNTKFLRHELEQFRRLYQDKAPFNESEARSRVQRSLSFVEEFVVHLAESTLASFSQWDRGVDAFQEDLTQVSALIRRMKSDTGAFVIGQDLGIGLAADARPAESEMTATADYIGYPKDDLVDINLFVLEEVGGQIEAIERDEPADGGTPLIVRILPGEERPRFWSTTNDFFTPSVMSADPEQWRSSFSQAYGLNPLPPGLRA
jgi:hypothetical protein